jgi:hypothetical protein
MLMPLCNVYPRRAMPAFAWPQFTAKPDKVYFASMPDRARRLVLFLGQS